MRTTASEPARAAPVFPRPPRQAGQVCEIVVRGLHGNSRGVLVDETLEDLDGVICSTSDVRRGRALVEFEPSAVNVEDLTATIDDLAYSSAPAGTDGA